MVVLELDQDALSTRNTSVKQECEMFLTKRQLSTFVSGFLPQSSLVKLKKSANNSDRKNSSHGCSVSLHNISTSLVEIQEQQRS